MFSFICRMAHYRKAKVIVIIHDLGSFRRKKLTASQEIKRLSHADYIIAHNSKMKQWLIDKGCQIPIGELGIFDYLSESQTQTDSKVLLPYKIAYAGALNFRKNTFLYEIGAHIHPFSFYLYGNGFDLNRAKGKEHFQYMGFIPSDQLISTIQGDFGLVWDGLSIDACTGSFGDYLRYNNPHKTSLYIRCGLPIIIWEQAALAPFIKEHNIGICVDSLTEVAPVLASLTESEYKLKKENVLKLSSLLANGYFITQALSEGYKTLNSHEKV